MRHNELCRRNNKAMARFSQILERSSTQPLLMIAFREKGDGNEIALICREDLEYDPEVIADVLKKLIEQLPKKKEEFTVLYAVLAVLQCGTSPRADPTVGSARSAEGDGELWPLGSNTRSRWGRATRYWWGGRTRTTAP